MVDAKLQLEALPGARQRRTHHAGIVDERVEARLLRAGTNLTFAAAEIFDGSGQVTARCDGTVAVAMGRYEEFFPGMRGPV